MWEWCRHLVFDAVTDAAFGPVLRQQRPDAWAVYTAFEKQFWKLNFGLPDWDGSGRKAREDLRILLRDFYHDKEMIEETSPEIVWKRQEMVYRAGITEYEAAAANIGFFWGLHTNITKAAFWLPMYVLSTPGLVDRIRSELASSGVFNTPGGAPDIDKLLKKCPILNASLQEALRLAASSTGVRMAESDVQLGGYTIKKGSLLLLPTSHLHRSRESWGQDADTFRPDRWTKLDVDHDGAGGGAGQFRPFGGGVTHCPGRFIARRGLLAFVAILLDRYQVEMVGAPKEPDMKKPGVGVMDPAGGVSGLKLKLTPRHVKA